MSKLKFSLERMREKYGTDYLETDPLGIVRELPRREAEVGGLLAAALALGRVSSIRSKVRDIFSRLDGLPASFIKANPPAAIRSALRGFRHRFFGEEETARLLAGARRIIRREGTLGTLFGRARERSAGFRGGVESFVSMVEKAAGGPIRGKGGIPLLPSPVNGSASKRTLLFLRWMIRPDDGIDLGLWRDADPSELIVPLDVHLFRISRLLGLTSRKTPSYAAAEEITAKLSRFSPNDPVAYDFALTRLGIAEGCGGVRSAVCDGCGMEDLCLA